MTSPDHATPGAAQIGSSIAQFYQTANKDALAQNANLDLWEVLDQVRESVFGMLGGFGDVAEAVWDGIQALIEALTGGGGSLDDVVDWVESLGGAVLDLLQGVIPLGWLSATTPNLLANGGFDSAVSMVEGEGWLYDAGVGRTGLGSARFTGAGVRGLQQSTPVQVAEGQELDAEVWAKWSGVTTSSSAAAWKLAVRWWDGETLLAETVIASKASPGASSDWAKLSGSATTPAGATLATLALIVEDVVTAGSVWWDDASLRKPATSIPQQWVDGLLDALNSLGDLIEHLVDQALTALGLPTLGTIGERIFDLADELGAMLGLGEDNAAGLDTLIDKLLHDPAAVLGSIPKAMVAGLESALAGIDDFVQDLIDALLRALRGIPVVGGTLADIISDLGGLKDTTDTTQQQVSTGIGGQAITVGVLENMRYHLVSYKTVGTATWTPSAHSVPSGFEIDHYIVTSYGGGQGGGRAGTGGPGGRNGGRRTARLSPAEVGSSQTVTVGAGGSGATSDGYGGTGGTSSFGNLVASTVGSSAIPTVFGDLPSSACPGDGGAGGERKLVDLDTRTGSTTSSSGSHSHAMDGTFVGQMGSNGGSSSGAAGGSGGSLESAWWGSPTSPTAGADGALQGATTTGGGGGGGGGGRGTGGSGQAGAAGGAPGGGGGGGGARSTSLYSGGNGGAGGRGQVDVCAMFRPVA
ncbi:hypothetical protein [Gordonia sp. (in: high G+C Gram-positive bacteria)]|uniref:glycine-rich domain-containing protein n=1 Tax=Gordonia sp. (in: high G+C Gram-positive bacteria) TaxID=84139 RepID=UPI0033418358